MNAAILGGFQSRFRMPHIVTVLRQWQITSAGRHTLRNLSDRDLQDIGVTRHDADVEARRWVWDDAPRTRSSTW